MSIQLTCDVCSKSFDNYRKLNGHKQSHFIGIRADRSDKGISRPFRGVYKSKKITLCKNCLVPLISKPREQKYCSVTCEKNWNYQNITKPKIEDGLARTKEVLKKYLIIERGNICEICRCDPIHNGQPLGFQLDHVDGNSDNNLPSNIRLVCPNCHSQTPTFMGRNVGKHQTHRSRYRKSYYHCDGVVASPPKLV